MRYEDYVQVFNSGDILDRRFLAEHFGVGRSTAKYHLEKAVNARLLNKQWGWTGRMSGWLYALPDTMPRLID